MTPEDPPTAPIPAVPETSERPSRAARTREGAGRSAPRSGPRSRRRAGSGRRAEPAGHGHGHGHGPAPAVGRTVRRLLAALLVPCGLAVVVGLVLLAPSPSEYRAVLDGSHAAAAGSGAGTTTGAAAAVATQPLDGTVVRAGAEADCADPTLAVEAGAGCFPLQVRLDEGPASGRTIDTLLPGGPATPRFADGDAVVVAWSGGDPADASGYQVVDRQRGGSMLLLAGVFALAVVLLGRWQGLAALGALGITLLVLGLFVLPALLTGAAPVPVALVASGLIVAVVFPTIHGFSARTATAALGTVMSLGLIGVLALVFGGLTRLTGLDDSSTELIGVLGAGIDARGLLLAGLIIGALGVLDDVTVTQTSTVWELHRADPSSGTRELYAAAMRVGRDHVASAVNTLVLAYAGAALPLLLLFTLSGRGVGDLLTAEDVAQEVLRTLVGSIGIVAAVPVTTLVAAVVARSGRAPRPGRSALPRA
ncbi:YibE/F family protein [Actinomycetospora soli]|uniref:YibE/F family protein n=1 Tax=Actinomycetospora soli TaxID=2893887 RepID=UPI001E28B915|nr:YibE/F family protein [Actinomycetospora soli]MCD2185753.1 YibE/F family protein [Actinomycetospora soli]